MKKEEEFEVCDRVHFNGCIYVTRYYLTEDRLEVYRDGSFFGGLEPSFLDNWLEKKPIKFRFDVVGLENRDIDFINYFVPMMKEQWGYDIIPTVIIDELGGTEIPSNFRHFNRMR